MHCSRPSIHRSFIDHSYCCIMLSCHVIFSSTSTSLIHFILVHYIICWLEHSLDNSDPNAAATAPSRTGQPAPKKSKGNVAKIDEYISKISSYKAGGDGGKCLKILLAYIKNVVANPTEDKFKKINMDNKAYKTKVKPFVGAKILLMAVGFAPNDGNTALVLGDDSDMEVLAQTKEKLEKAFAAY